MKFNEKKEDEIKRMNNIFEDKYTAPLNMRLIKSYI